MDREQGLELFAEANARRTKACEAMLLLGDETTVTAVRAWQDAVGAEAHPCPGDSIDEIEWHRLWRQLTKLVTASIPPHAKIWVYTVVR
jgi:hypothetical protein